MSNKSEIPLSERTGMSICLDIYAEITADGYDLGGKSVRQCFLKRAVEEAGMTARGAETYYNSCKRKAEGKTLYYHKPKTEKKPKADKAIQTFTEIANELIEQQKLDRAIDLAMEMANEPV